MRVKHTHPGYAKDIRFDPSSTELITERAGYVPIENRINALMNAGAHLDEFRRRSFRDGTRAPMDDEPVINPTARKDFDIFEAHSYERALDNANRERQEAIDKALNEKVKTAKEEERKGKIPKPEAPPPTQNNPV